jgi:hypothetical protein
MNMGDMFVFAAELIMFVWRCGYRNCGFDM